MNESETAESKSTVISHTTRSSLQGSRSRSSQLSGGSEGSGPNIFNVVAPAQNVHCDGAFCMLGLAGGYATALDEPPSTTE